MITNPSVCSYPAAALQVPGLITMARVPFIGRLFWFEYLALFGSLILVLLEWIIHIITFCLRK